LTSATPYNRPSVSKRPISSCYTKNQLYSDHTLML